MYLHSLAVPPDSSQRPRRRLHPAQARRRRAHPAFDSAPAYSSSSPSTPAASHPPKPLRQASDVRRQPPKQRTHVTKKKKELHCRSPAPRSAPHYWERRLISCFCFASHVGHSSDGPPALVAHSPVGGLLSCFRSGETQSRRGTHSSDSVHSANPEECGAGVTHPDTAHEMRIPLRPLRMSKPYRRLRKSRLREESVTALLEMSVPTVSPSSET